MTIDSQMQSHRRQALDRVFQRWLNDGLNYGIASGYNPEAHEIGRDVDVVIGQNQINQAWRAACKELESLGWEVSRNKRPWAFWVFAFLRKDNRTTALEIDLLPYLQSGIYRIQSGASDHTAPSGEKGWNLDPRARFIKRVVLQLIAGNSNKFDDCDLPITPSPDESQAIGDDPLLTWFSVQLACAKSLPDLMRLGRRLKLRMYVNAIRKPRTLPVNFLFSLRRSIALNLFARQAAPIIMVHYEPTHDIEGFLTDLSEKLRSCSFLKPVIHDFNDNSCTWFELPIIGKLHRWIFFILHFRFVALRKSVRLYPYIYLNHPAQQHGKVLHVILTNNLHNRRPPNQIWPNTPSCRTIMADLAYGDHITADNVFKGILDDFLSQ